MKVTEEDILNLKRISNNVRKSIVEEVYSAQSGHPGGALSCADILTVLYFNQMNIDPEKKDDLNRDRLVLSKGHASAALYAVLAERGYFSKDELKGFRKLGSMLQGHPDMKHIPGVDMTAGSLGQGLSVANGMAISSKLDERGFRVYCIVGDGEIEEGQIWEALMSSNKYNLNNLIIFVDHNGLQIDGTTKDVKSVDNLDKKFEAFGLNVQKINGNNINEIINAVKNAKDYLNDRPNVIIADTVKGKGISFMENKVEWHGKALNDEELQIALNELK